MIFGDFSTGTLVRQGIIFGVLALVVGGFAYDRFVVKANCDAAYAFAMEKVQANFEPGKRKRTTPETVSKEFGFKPQVSEVKENCLVEEYHWARPVPGKTYFVSILYAKEQVAPKTVIDDGPMGEKADAETKKKIEEANDNAEYLLVSAKQLLAMDQSDLSRFTSASTDTKGIKFDEGDVVKGIGAGGRGMRQRDGKRGGKGRGRPKTDEDNDAKSSKEEPAKEEPAKEEPAKKSQPRKSQPRKSQPRKSQPRKSQPRKSQPRKSQPRKSQPRKSQPRKSQPRKSQPRKSQPKKSQPKKSQPRKSQLRKSQLRKSQLKKSQLRKNLAKKKRNLRNQKSLANLKEIQNPISRICCQKTLTFKSKVRVLAYCG